MPRTKGLKDYPSELKDKIVKEREAGASLRQIARKYNVSVYSVGAWCGQVSRVNTRMQMPLKRGRPTNKPEDLEKKVKRLEMENELLRNFLRELERK